LAAPIVAIIGLNDRRRLNAALDRCEVEMDTHGIVDSGNESTVRSLPLSDEDWNEPSDPALNAAAREGYADMIGYFMGIGASRGFVKTKRAFKPIDDEIVYITALEEALNRKTIHAQLDMPDRAATVRQLCSSYLRHVIA
jgi:hypothetical protein